MKSKIWIMPSVVELDCYYTAGGKVDNAYEQDGNVYSHTFCNTHAGSVKLHKESRSPNDFTVNVPANATVCYHS